MKHLGKIILSVSVFLCFFAGLYCLCNPILERIAIYHDTVTLTVGDWKDIQYAVFPDNIEKLCDIRWESSNEDVVEVFSNSASLLAKGVGQATITATGYGWHSSKQTESFVVIVKPKLVSSVSLETEFTTIQVGTSAQITSKVLPNNATDKTLVWESSNASVISVEQNGTITAQSEGTAIITATAVGGASAQITITAQTEILPESIVITSSSYTLDRGSSYSLKYEISPQNATVTTVSWKSSNPDVVSVDENGKIKANELGSATITVETSNGKSYSCYITVPVVEPTYFMLSVDYQKVIKLKVGDTYQISYNYRPSNVTYSIVWSSSHSDIISVDQNGRITVHASGSAVITAKLGSIERSVILTIAPT